MSKGKCKQEGLSISGGPLPKQLEQINLWAAGIDIGAESHFVAVPEGCSDTLVKEFKSFTPDLYKISDWLKSCGIKTVAMESTGTFWIPLYEILESAGFEVKLVDARQVKNVSGRKTDVLDCQWLQQLHTYGLLNGAFRPDEEIVVLRSYVRQRNMLIKHLGMSIQHMQKALTQMNLKLQHVLADITGETGMKIIRSILLGEREAKELAKYRNFRCKKSEEEIAAALTGNYRGEHIFALKQAVEIYDFYKKEIEDCDGMIEKQLLELEERHGNKSDLTERKRDDTKNTVSFNVGKYLYSLTGVDLLKIPGINSLTALIVVSEIGLDMSRFKDAKRFASWLGLCSGNKVSGGKRLGGKSKATSSRAAAALRMAASTLYRSQTALGGFLRRLKSRIGPSKAITATAHKLAKIIYNMLRYGESYREVGLDRYEEVYRERVVRNLKKKAEALGFELVEKGLVTA